MSTFDTEYELDKLDMATDILMSNFSTYASLESLNSNDLFIVNAKKEIAINLGLESDKNIFVRMWEAFRKLMGRLKELFLSLFDRHLSNMRKCRNSIEKSLKRIKAKMGDGSKIKIESEFFDYKALDGLVKYGSNEIYDKPAELIDFVKNGVDDGFKIGNPDDIFSEADSGTIDVKKVNEILLKCKKECDDYLKKYFIPAKGVTPDHNGYVAPVGNLGVRYHKKTKTVAGKDYVIDTLKSDTYRPDVPGSVITSFIEADKRVIVNAGESALKLAEYMVENVDSRKKMEELFKKLDDGINRVDRKTINDKTDSLSFLLEAGKAAASYRSETARRSFECGATTVSIYERYLRTIRRSF